jgi:hypothetical protein
VRVIVDVLGQQQAAASTVVLVVAQVGEPRGLGQAVGDVDPEAVDPQVEPEAQRRLERGANPGVGPVEVGLLGGEEVQVPLAGAPRRPP